jgi:hypothetical protein
MFRKNFHVPRKRHKANLRDAVCDGWTKRVRFIDQFFSEHLKGQSHSDIFPLAKEPTL